MNKEGKMIELTYEDLKIMSDCVMYRMNEMYKAKSSFLGCPDTLGKIDDDIKKLQRINIKIAHIMTKKALEQRTQ